MGFDQLMTMYEHFCVTHCHYRITYAPYASASTAPLAVGTTITGGVVSSTEITELMEQPLSNYKIIYGS
jgi:hypothetical protein